MISVSYKMKNGKIHKQILLHKKGFVISMYKIEKYLFFAFLYQQKVLQLQFFNFEQLLPFHQFKHMRIRVWWFIIIFPFLFSFIERKISNMEATFFGNWGMKRKYFCWWLWGTSNVLEVAIIFYSLLLSSWHE
jgi:hypothetical protein